VAIARLEEFIDYCININLFKEKDEGVALFLKGCIVKIQTKYKLMNAKKNILSYSSQRGNPQSLELGVQL